MEIRAVLFDLDNTLFDHSTAANAALEALLRFLGANPSEQLKLAWFDIERDHYDRFLSGELSFPEQRRERLRQFLPLVTGVQAPTTDRSLDELFAIYLREYEQAWSAFPDAAPTLQNLRNRGMAVGVVTNGNHSQQTSKITRIGLAPLLDQVFSSEQSCHAKPAPQAFLHACRSMQIAPAQTLYLGDNFHVDVTGARNAGLKAVHLKRHGGEKPGSIRSLAELAAVAGWKAESLTSPAEAHPPIAPLPK